MAFSRIKKPGWNLRYLPFKIVDICGQISGLSIISLDKRAIEQEKVVISKLGVLVMAFILVLLGYCNYIRFSHRGVSITIQLLLNSSVTKLTESLFLLIHLLMIIFAFASLIKKGPLLPKIIRTTRIMDRKLLKYNIDLEIRTAKKLFIIGGMSLTSLFTIGLHVYYRVFKLKTTGLNSIIRMIAQYAPHFYMVVISVQFVCFACVILVRLQCLSDLISSWIKRK
jgi:hypothetical protein